MYMGVIFKAGNTIMGLNGVSPLLFTKEFLLYAEEIWQLEFRGKTHLLIEHENGFDVYKIPEHHLLYAVSPKLMQCPHKITHETPVFLQKLIKPKIKKIISLTEEPL